MKEIIDVSMLIDVTQKFKIVPLEKQKCLVTVDVIASPEFIGHKIKEN